MKSVAFCLPLLLVSAAHAAGGAVGRQTVLLSPEGKVLHDFGETRRVIFDAETGLLYRCNDREIVAAKIAEPESVLWRAAIANSSHWRPLTHVLGSSVLAVVDGRSIVGLDKATGNKVYTHQLGAAVVEVASAPKGSFYLIDNSQTRPRPAWNPAGTPSTLPARTEPATLTRIAAETGKKQWTLSFKDPDSTPLNRIQPGGVVDRWFFDEEKGVQLENAPVVFPMTLEEYLAKAGEKSNLAVAMGLPQISLDDRLCRVMPAIQKAKPGLVQALSLTGEKVLWEFQPDGPDPDENNTRLVRVRAGILVHVSWLRLD